VREREKERGTDGERERRNAERSRAVASAWLNITRNLERRLQRAWPRNNALVVKPRECIAWNYCQFAWILEFRSYEKCPRVFNCNKSRTCARVCVHPHFFWYNFISALVLTFTVYTMRRIYFTFGRGAYVFKCTWLRYLTRVNVRERHLLRSIEWQAWTIKEVSLIPQRYATHKNHASKRECMSQLAN